MRMNVQSLAPGLKIEIPVIDTFASILNYEEWELEKDIKRHYFYASVMLPGIIQNKPESMETKIGKQYEEFAKMIVIQMEDDISRLQFDDNGVFAKHLSTYLHPKAEEYMNQKKKPTILNMKWKTKKEKIDCGLFMMMHMDNYEGKIKWETGMLEETNKNHRLQRNNLRAKYAAKMMLHEINENQKLMSDYALKFAAENQDEKEADKIVNQSIMKKIAEQDKQDNQGK
ncbi:hypothetical protein CTI12_AA542020 [Artemisia annua]|uniref:Ulp1 protease family, C-terminal catalytic domain-containing protein n=1 Tax=Artemisia annua TaxID=35608 RepID=A0A2U1L157_ARTAN|nr:hypothetical protein CTI12_AA542020 [Artemisia annua]